MKIGMTTMAAATLLLVWGSALATSYPVQGTCAGFPAVPLQTPPGLCVGLVADHLGYARGVAVLGETIYVADMGGWRKGHGRLLRLGHSGHDAAQTVLAGLDEPSGLVADKDGTLIIGELGRVARVHPDAAPPSATDVLTGLPGTGRHPLTAMALAPDGSLYVNVGSGTDHCEQHGGKPGAKPPSLCPEAVASPPRASILHAPADGPTRAATAQVVATGLRNSMALAVTECGTLLAAVNERDYIDRADPALPDASLPNDVLDVVRPGANYGWPYCFDGTQANPEYRPHDCAAVQKPTLLLPPHAAPLGLLIYHGDLPGLAGHVLITYHGYRTAGHRVMSLVLGPGGTPVGSPTPLVWGWADPTTHVPLGGLTGLAQLPDGSVLVTDDGNGALLRLARR